MNSILMLKKSNCKNCHKCIRYCPVKSIRFADNQAHIIHDECILCGRCFEVCPQNAKVIRNDVDKVKQQLAAGRKVIASVAPSFIADFPVSSIRAFEKMLAALGFASADETAKGAEIVKSAYEDMGRERKHNILISTCCHTVNTLVQKYYPELIKYLAHTASPMLAHAEYIKSIEPDAYVVFIGPCISKKAEQEEYGKVDCVLTFDELREWIEAENISFEEQSREEDTPYRSRFFPTTGGIIKSMDLEDNYNYIAVDGVENCIAALKEIEDGKLKDCFLEMSACEGSCLGGPAMQRFKNSPISCKQSLNHYSGGGDLKIPKNVELDKDLPYTGVRSQRPGEKAIREILARMGKTKPEDELNCGSCGYNTCRDKAVAVYMGKADITMCLPFIKERAESFSDKIISNTPNGIFVLDENLNVQQINRAACALFNIDQPSTVVNTPVVRILNPTDYMNVIETGNSVYEKQYYLAEYGKYVEEDIVYDKEYHLIISIMKDITERESENEKKQQLREETVDITDKVIEKQMRVVQEIASLLGETTAETKIALTKLKETLTK